jgi:hypothetical protein
MQTARAYVRCSVLSSDELVQLYRDSFRYFILQLALHITDLPKMV